MFEMLESSADDLADLRRANLASQVAPFDGMWEAFAGMARQWQIRADGEPVGYFCVNAEGQLLQFYVAPPLEHVAPDLFAAAVLQGGATGAMVSTADPLFLSLCLDLQKQVKVHTYLYRDHTPGESAFAPGARASLEVVEAGELDEVVRLQQASLDQDLGDWLVGYLENLIARRELHALRLGGEILATGETRVSESQPPFVDLGVITMRGHRRRGVASHVLWRLKQLCRDREQVPICSTTLDNVGAQRAITKAGFVSRHRVLEITLPPGEEL